MALPAIIVAMESCAFDLLCQWSIHTNAFIIIAFRRWRHNLEWVSFHGSKISAIECYEFLNNFFRSVLLYVKCVPYLDSTNEEMNEWMSNLLQFCFGVKVPNEIHGTEHFDNNNILVFRLKFATVRWIGRNFCTYKMCKLLNICHSVCHFVALTRRLCFPHSVEKS